MKPTRRIQSGGDLRGPYWMEATGPRLAYDIECRQQSEMALHFWLGCLVGQNSEPDLRDLVETVVAALDFGAETYAEKVGSYYIRYGLEPKPMPA